MRQIKFRGISKDTDKIVFGYYLKSIDDAQIFDGEYFHSVKPESVVQFICLDKNGEEIYEDDILISERILNDMLPAFVEAKAHFITPVWDLYTLKK